MESWERMKQAVAAVSYTHLDVYKRQGLDLAQIHQATGLTAEEIEKL